LTSSYTCSHEPSPHEVRVEEAALSHYESASVVLVSAIYPNLLLNSGFISIVSIILALLKFIFF